MLAKGKKLIVVLILVGLVLVNSQFSNVEASSEPAIIALANGQTVTIIWDSGFSDGRICIYDGSRIVKVWYDISKGYSTYKFTKPGTYHITLLKRAPNTYLGWSHATGTTVYVSKSLKVTSDIDWEYEVDIPAIKQVKSYYCGWATAHTIIEGLGKNIRGSGNTAEQKYLAGRYGSEYKSAYVYQVRNALNGYLGWKYRYKEVRGNLTYNQFIAEVAGSLRQGYPVVLHAVHEYLPYYQSGRGHYVVVTGIKAREVNGQWQYFLVIQDPHYSSKYFGEHIINAVHGYNSVNEKSGRYIIYVD